MTQPLNHQNAALFFNAYLHSRRASSRAISYELDLVYMCQGKHADAACLALILEETASRPPDRIEPDGQGWWAIPGRVARTRVAIKERTMQDTLKRLERAGLLRRKTFQDTARCRVLHFCIVTTEFVAKMQTIDQILSVAAAREK